MLDWLHHQDNKNYSLKAKFDKLFQHLVLIHRHQKEFEKELILKKSLNKKFCEFISNNFFDCLNIKFK